MASLNQQRLLHDIHEISTKSYPNIHFHSHENNINKGCLVLTPPGMRQIHLTVDFPPQYPLVAPRILIQTLIKHPNVFGDYICASILNTKEGYTPAYTLKGIAIQILSFFNSDRIEQQYGGEIDMTKYNQRNKELGKQLSAERFTCSECGFPAAASTLSTSEALPTGIQRLTLSVRTNTTNGSTAALPSSKGKSNTTKNAMLIKLPHEILIQICDYLEIEELVVFMRASDRIGGANGVVTHYNLIRTRELQCFALKEGYGTARLGVGVHVGRKGRQGTIESEFDLLSEKGYEKLNIRKSVQGIIFERWLPLPISRRHFELVKKRVEPALSKIGMDACLDSQSQSSVLFAFMNDVVVKLSAHASDNHTPAGSRYGSQPPPDSSLIHASEKAIESYYHLFHLLLCIASEDKTVVANINHRLKRFLKGHNDKEAVPNLGHLLIMVLLSDYDMDEALTMAIIKEAVTRNVVWMLDGKGAGMPELSYMEADPISQYRLGKTFEASRTSYRLLMFFNLFRNTVNRGLGEHRKTVGQLRDELFDRYGAPPSGAATRLAADVKRLQDINDFPNFIQIMGLKPPRASEFTTFLRQCCQDSMSKGYSVWAYSQEYALELRRAKEAGVGVRPAGEHKAEWKRSAGSRGASFFPFKRGHGKW